MRSRISSANFAFIAIGSSLAIVPAQAGNSPPKTSWEVSGEFNSACPTTGPWRYMSRVTAPSALPVPMTNAGGAAPINRCTGAAPYPIVGQNSQEVVFNDPAPASGVHAARGVWLHPGAACEDAIVRFVTPYSGTYAVTGQFYGLDNNGSKTKTKVSIVGVNAYLPAVQTTFLDSVDLPAGKLRAAFRRSFLIAAGKTVDFVVGCPTGGSYGFGSTGLHAVIEYWGPGRQPKALDNPFAGGGGSVNMGGPVDYDPR